MTGYKKSQYEARPQSYTTFRRAQVDSHSSSHSSETEKQPFIYTAKEFRALEDYNEALQRKVEYWYDEAIHLRRELTDTRLQLAEANKELQAKTTRTSEQRDAELAATMSANELQAAYNLARADVEALRCQLAEYERFASREQTDAKMSVKSQIQQDAELAAKLAEEDEPEDDIDDATEELRRRLEALHPEANSSRPQSSRTASRHVPPTRHAHMTDSGDSDDGADNPMSHEGLSIPPWAVAYGFTGTPSRPARGPFPLPHVSRATHNGHMPGTCPSGTYGPYPRIYQQQPFHPF